MVQWAGLEETIGDTPTPGEEPMTKRAAASAPRSRFPLPSPWKLRFDAFFSGRLVYAAISALALAPCYWQPRIQAGDLSSHIYNAWLAQLIEGGRAPGLIVAPQTTNVLFDLILGSLFRMFGADAAQRLAVGLAVLVFIWGAFAFSSAVAGRRAWNLMPCIAMLAYGWVFHMGFFNFYLALGLCFWAMALAWEPRPARLVAAAGALALAYVAHALPVLWCLCLLVYLALMRRRSPRQRALATMALLALMVMTRIAVQALFSARWFPAQMGKFSGADQVWAFDDKYYWIVVGLLFLWGVSFLRLIAQGGARRALAGIPFQFFVLTAGGIAILPTTVLIPGFLHALAYIAERMSLGAGICVCAFLGAAPRRAFERYAMLGLAVVFFAFLFRDERALNSFEDRLDGAVAQARPGQRIVSLVDDPDLRANALTHMIDRACVGRCYSYANYEPTTAQFRVRAVADNPIVVRTYAESWALQTGIYRVKPADAPLYGVDLDGSGQLVVKELKAGTLCGSTFWKVLPALFPGSWASRGARRSAGGACWPKRVYCWASLCSLPG